MAVSFLEEIRYTLKILYGILWFSVTHQQESAIDSFTHVPSLQNLPPISLPIPPFSQS